MNDKIKSAISSLRNFFPIDSVYVFGSYGRSEESRESDIDILVVFCESPQDPFEVAFRIRRYLHEQIDYALDVIVTSKENFDQRLHHPWTIEHIAYTEGVAV